MVRALVPLVTASVLLLSSDFSAQAPAGPGQGAPTPGTFPGLPPGAQRPGLPTRDNAAQRPDSNASPAASPRVGATPADPSTGWIAANDPEATGEVDAADNFRLGGVFGRVFLTMSPLSGWTVRSIALDGQDITDKAIDVAGLNVDGVRITMTDKLTNVAGGVTDSRGSAIMQYVVVVQAADQMEPVSAMRYVRVTRPDTSGRFEFRNLRPGRYLATAIESMEQGRQGSPEFRRQLQRGAHAFSLKEGETLSLDLRLTPGL